MKKILTAVLMTFVAATLFTTVALAAADVSGTYTGTIKTNEGGAFEVELVLKQTGNKINGTYAQGNSDPRQIEEGTVSGDTVNFTLTYKSDKGSRKANFAGQISGNTLKLSRTIEGINRPPQQMSLTKEK